MTYYTLSILLFGVGLLGLVIKRNPLSKLVCLSMTIMGIVLLLVLLTWTSHNNEAQTHALFVLIAMVLEISVGVLSVFTLLKTKSAASLIDIEEPR